MSIKCFSQICTNIKETINFGKGANPGAPIPEMNVGHWQLDGCPPDFHYIVVNQLAGNCYPVNGKPAWHKLESDHTGNVNGYMVMVNTPTSGEVFYEKEFNNLCPNSIYYFEMYAANIKTDTVAGVFPLLSMEIKGIDNTLIVSTKKELFRPGSTANWKKISGQFNSGNFTSIKLSIIDFADPLVRNGDDFVMDDISLTGPRSYIPPDDESFTDADPIINVSKVILPNSFTPNGDGFNDKWTLSGINLYPNSQVIVYNRYGKPVFNSKGIHDDWDGTSNGSPLPVGTYYYIIDLKDKSKKISGWLLLIN